jgi:putative ABC transport system permease protein
MIKNYLRIAFRNLWRQKGFSLLNIIGLTVGMTAFFLIFLYVRFELSYDSFHTRADRIYRLVSDVKTSGEIVHYNAPPLPVAEHLMTDFPELQSVARVSLGDDWMVIRNDKVFRVDDVAVADSNFFRVFDFRLLKGDPNTVLKNPNSVVLSESEAKRFFGNADPVGQSLTMTRIKFRSTVTGVMQDLPVNSHLKVRMICSADTLDADQSQQWNNYGNNIYLLLKPSASVAGLQAKFPAFLQKIGGAALHKAQKQPALLLEPLRDIYLYSTRDGLAKGNITNVRIFSIIGVFILLIAGINFVNLTTARSGERAKEVGIRKVVGASKAMLAGQFIGESIILSLIACVISVLLSALLLPGFNHLAGKEISQGILSQPRYPLLLLSLSVLIGIIAGFYPALVLSSFQPVAVLKGRFSSGVRGIFLRKALVIVQFTIATGLIIATLIVYNQLSYMRSQDLGFNKDQELILDTRGDSATAAFRQEVAMIPGVLSVTRSSSVPGGGMYYGPTQLENVRGEMQTTNVNAYLTDYDYIKQFGIRLAVGRDFSRQYSTDSTRSAILNETAVRVLGYSNPAQAIGKRFQQFGAAGNIIGVVKDFHFRSLQETIRPLILFLSPEFGGLFLYFAILAISISCLGLMGLASYSTLQRTKEIGVRKVVGASVRQIVVLLSKDFLVLVGWSFVVAAPISWLFISAWLNSFAYRIHSYWWIFIAAGVTALLIALLTISFQAIRAALANPVMSLRSE